MFSKNSFKLRIVLSLFFISFTIPSFLAFLSYSYFSNLKNYESDAKELISRHNTETIKDLSSLFTPIASSLTFLKGQIERDPSSLRSSKLDYSLIDHLRSNDRLVSVFVVTQDGLWRYIQKNDGVTLIAGRKPPKETAFTIWNYDKLNTKDKTISNYTFYKDVDVPIESFVLTNAFDARVRPYFKNMLERIQKDPSGKFIQINDPYIALVNRKPTFLLATPLIIKGEFAGLIAESFDIATISSFLKSNEVSQSSETYIINELENVMVRTKSSDTYVERSDDGLLNFKKIDHFKDSPVQFISSEQASQKSERFEFIDNNGKRFLAQFSVFPVQYNQSWRVLSVAPIDDFLDGLKQSNNELILYSSCILIVLIIACYYASRIISKPLERITGDVQNLLELKTANTQDKPTSIYELSVLSNAVNKLKVTLNAFICFVPRGLVNDLLISGQAIETGGESRYLTMLFSDLKDFSTLSEITPSRELLRRVSSYLELFTHAINEETGTVDKFIGDSVMAFWGAPLLNQDHAYHACVAAIKAKVRMKDLNAQLLKEGHPPLVVRVGIHTDAVLVGNIGSQERMSYTVMGDGVNIASRLEGINKEFGTSICVSHNVFKETGERLWLRPIDQIAVKGRKGLIQIYELLGIRDSLEEINADQRSQALCTATEKAYRLYAAGKFVEAMECYKQNDAQYNDGLSRIMAAKCLTHMNPQ
jgi:adenylate cyclase